MLFLFFFSRRHLCDNSSCANVDPAWPVENPIMMLACSGVFLFVDEEDDDGLYFSMILDRKES